MKKRFSIIALVIALIVAVRPATACPNCQAGVASEMDNNALGGSLGNPALGYNLSVLFMMAMPFLIVAGFATAVYRMCRKQHTLAEKTTESMDTADELCALPAYRGHS